MAGSETRLYDAATECGEKEPFLISVESVDRVIAEEDAVVPPCTQRQTRLLRHLLLSLFANLLLVATLLSTILLQRRGSFFSFNPTSSVPTLYSPALAVADNPKLVKFSPAFGPNGHETIYREAPSPEVDAAWSALYYTTLTVDRATAEQLPNRTIPVSAASDAGFLVGLSVFHDLHCLDSIRKALWASHGEAATTTAEEAASYAHEAHDAAHLMHCVDNLRQSLMCHADVAPLSWQWSKEEGGVRVFSDVTHQCRDFDAVLEWGRTHYYQDGVDSSGFIDGRPSEMGKCGVGMEGCGWPR